MQGKILDFDASAQTGTISGNDGKRYAFSKADWKSSVQPKAGNTVDFVENGENATEIYKSQTSSGEANKIVAALLAFFLGGLGIHKFYLGYKKEGIIMLLCFFPGILLFGIPTIIAGLIAFIEFIIYLMKSDSEFEETYIDGHRPWF